MLDVTPQERMALVALAVLLSGGAVARHSVNRADARSWLEYTAEAADSLNPATLRQAADAELALARIRSTPLAAGERIDPNSAPAEQLARLPRVGPALAERIVAHRTANGPFRTLEDMRSVAGIGPALMEGIAGHVTLARGPGGGSTQAGGEPIDINRASAAELERLPGIGPALAERIVAYRQANGPFRSAEELERVSGIGPRLRERLERSIRIGR